jgi:23S rRNA pseudouridine1911/1915/1917 synthase
VTSPPVSLDVLHVDNHLLVVRKPSGLPTVPDASGDESLLDLGKAWIAREFSKPGAVYLGVVHRLDRPVSGVVCMARTSKAAGRLQPAFAERRVSKVYRGVAEAAPSEPAGELVQWLHKDRERNTVRVVREGHPDARRAVTRWRVLEERAGRCLVELEPCTGRSHQLRVAMASLGRPLLGDLRYGATAPLPDRSVALHALSLELDHPVGGEHLRFEAPPPTTSTWRFGESSSS